MIQLIQGEGLLRTPPLPTPPPSLFFTPKANTLWLSPAAPIKDREWIGGISISPYTEWVGSTFLSLSPPLRVRNNLRSPDICFLKVCLSSSSGICHAADNQVGPLNPDDKSELRRKPFCGRIPSLDGTLGEKIGRRLIWSYPTFPLETPLDRTSFGLNFVWSLMWATSIENSLTCKGAKSSWILNFGSRRILKVLTSVKINNFGLCSNPTQFAFPSCIVTMCFGPYTLGGFWRAQ